MNLPLVSLSILDPLYSLFGWIMRLIYSVFGNYGVAVIIFTVLIRLIILPFNVKQHKSSIQQKALQPELADLQRYYGSDKEGYAQAQMELYKKHGVSLTGGCLPSLFSLFLVWPMYRIISGPLYFIMQVSVESLSKITEILVNAGIVSETIVKQNLMHNNIFIIEALNDNPNILAEVVNKGPLSVDQLIDMDFLGMNLGLTPTINFGLLFGEQSSTYLPLIILPIIAFATSVLVMWYTQKVNAVGLSKKEKKAQQEKLKKNPALQAGNNTDAAANSAKTMMYIMPFLTLIFTFSMPAAMSIYWVAGNALAIFQTWLFDKVYTQPMAARQAEADKDFEERITARAMKEKAEIEALEAKNQKKKRTRRS